LLVLMRRMGSMICAAVGAKAAFESEMVRLKGAVAVLGPATPVKVAAVVCVFAFWGAVAGKEAESAFKAAVRVTAPEAPGARMSGLGEGVTPVGRPVKTTATGVALVPETCTCRTWEVPGYMVSADCERLTVKGAFWARAFAPAPADARKNRSINR
jgi:hypothetical protein